MTNSGTPSQPGPTSGSTSEPTDKAHGKGQTQGRGESGDTERHASRHDVQQKAGMGAPGRGGTSGGTPDAAGHGQPGAAQTIGLGRAGTPDAGAAGTPAMGGMGASGDPPAVTYGNTAPYRNTPDEAHRHGHLSVAGGSAGSGVGYTAPDAAADIVGDENAGAAESGHPSSGASAG